jgi:hypothetical protein
MGDKVEDEHGDLPMAVLPESIEIGEFTVGGGCLRADLRIVLSGRAAGKEYPCPVDLARFVEPHGDAIGVGVRDSILGFPSLAVVAEHVAATLNTVLGGAMLARTVPEESGGWRRGTQVRVGLDGFRGISNG